MKRVLTIQDISCVGRCSLTVALPVLSAMGLETAVLPTAVLSAHTAFPGFTFCDMTEQMLPIAQHWQQQKLGFDAVYTGYLGSPEQLARVQEILSRLAQPEQLVLVDPVMGDNGTLYTGFTADYARQMRELCAGADVIVPNLTEAALLLDRPYREEYSESELLRLLKELGDLGAGLVVLTGVQKKPDQLGAAAYRSRDGQCFTYFRRRQEQSFHGTGDLFASALLGGLCRGLKPKQAVALAVDFVVESIEKTLTDPQRRWYGVNFEQALPLLWQKLRVQLPEEGSL